MANRNFKPLFASAVESLSAYRAFHSHKLRSGIYCFAIAARLNISREAQHGPNRSAKNSMSNRSRDFNKRLQVGRLCLQANTFKLKSENFVVVVGENSILKLLKCKLAMRVYDTSSREKFCQIFVILNRFINHHRTIYHRANDLCIWTAASEVTRKALRKFT